MQIFNYVLCKRENTQNKNTRPFEERKREFTPYECRDEKKRSHIHNVHIYEIVND